MSRTALAARQERLALAAQAGDRRAADELVRTVLPFVERRAQSWSRAVPHLKEDLFAAGLEGLTVGINRFQPGRGSNVLSYAGLWIDAYMGKARETMMRSAAVSRASRQFRRLDADAQAAVMAPALSLEHSRFDDGDALGDRIADDAPDAEELLVDADERRAARERLDTAMAGLSPRERLVVEARLLVTPQPTLGAIAKRIGVSRERVRQIETEALRKLLFALGAAADAREVLARMVAARVPGESPWAPTSKRAA